MQIKIIRNMGGDASMEIDVEGKDEKETIARSVFFTQPDVCGKCGGTDIVWGSNKAKTNDGMFTYIKRKCTKCGAESTAGEYKEGGLFWKEWSIYQPKTGQESNNVGQNVGSYGEPQ